MIGAILRTGRGGAIYLPWLSAAIAALLYFQPVPAGAEDKGWVLTQKSSTLGDQYVYITQNGLKCYNPRAGFALVTHAPDWTITLFNDKTHVYYQTTLEKWKEELQAHGLSSEMRNHSWSKGSTGNMNGLRATEYVMSGTSSLHMPHGKTRTPITGATYWVSDDIVVPDKLADLLAAAYGVPTTQNIPLKLTCTEGGAKKVLLETYRTQQAPIPVSYFTYPAGYALAKNDAEVMMSDEQKEIMNDMAKQLEADGGGPAAAGNPAVGAPQTSGLTARPAAPGATTYRRAAPGAAPPATTTTSNTVNVGGVNLDRAKVQKFLDALKNPQNQQNQPKQ